MTVGDIVLDAEVGYVMALTFLNQQFQVVLGVERIEPTRWIAQAVDNISLKAVGVIDNRLYTISLIKAFGIEFGLVLALDG